MSEIEKTVYATLDDMSRRRRIASKVIRELAGFYNLDPRRWLDDNAEEITETKSAAVETKKPKRAPKASKRESKARNAPPRPRDASSGEGILATLKQHGPLRPGDLFHRLGLDHADGRARVKALEAIGKVTVKGNTNNRCVALVGTE